MSSSFVTPKKNSAGRAGSAAKSSRAKAVDLVTGKAIVEYFFDPRLVIQETNNSSTSFKTPSKSSGGGSISFSSTDPVLFSSKHLFMPCIIVKSLASEEGDAVPTPVETANLADDTNHNERNLGGPALVKTADGTLHKISDSSLLTPLISPDDYVGMSDVLNLANVTEPSLLHALRLRYKRDAIYTSAGPIMISVNPYKPVVLAGGRSMYSDEVMLEYRNADDFSDLEPHLFQVADRAYSALRDSVRRIASNLEEDNSEVMGDDGTHFHVPGRPRNQSIIISGESGAGKTEATKYIMQYLARITKKRTGAAGSELMSPTGKMIAALEDRVLSSNPLLETFGNAQTLYNDNSSRFGKFIQIMFSTSTGGIVGATVSNYLLEKTRITTQIDGERNYHIFYQLLASGKTEQLEKLGLSGGAEAFKYLSNKASPKTQKDADALVDTVNCLDRLGLDDEQQDEVFEVVAAVLHLGNIVFEEEVNENGEHIAIVSEESKSSLRKACDLLEIEEGDLSEAILTKLLTIGGKTIKKQQTVAMASDKRDAFAKMTYSCLFIWLVKSINETLSQEKFKDEGFNTAQPTDGEKLGFIGVLDIYGFECFEANGYEQMLINYCNEKLQRHFNRHLFEVEQNLYASEGVDWTYISFNDNRPCLELIEGGNGTVGIINTLDDAWGGMGSSSEKDLKFVSQLHKLFGGNAGVAPSAKKNDNGANKRHDYFVTPKFGNDFQFIIVHYAGEVRYTVNGFVEKNMETLSNELRDLGDSSKSELTKQVYACGGSEGEVQQATGATRRSTIRGVSVASQFKSSLQSLVDDLENTQPHYVRCIKPNLKKSANSFAAGEVLRQLRYSGMMEAIRIRREGYALREEHESFYNRFSVLLNPEDLGPEAGIVQLVDVLSKRLSVTDADWQIGHSKIFLRRDLSIKLERLARLRVHSAARTVGRFGRRVAQKCASRILVQWVRFRLHMMKVYRAARAATKIAAAFRMSRQIAVFKSTINAATKMQCLARSVAAKQVLRKLKDPYCDIDFKGLKKLLKTESATLEDAVKNKNFQVAAEQEQKIANLNAVIESRRPMTRPVLEAKIAEVQEKLDDAISKKAYAEASPLQASLEALIAKRADLPTMEELKQAVTDAEDAVAKAADERNFSVAAELQSKLDDAKKRLADAESNEKDDDESISDDESAAKQPTEIEGFSSRAELEAAIVGLQASIDEAIATKNFQQASSLQQTLDSREKLREYFPSLDDMKDKLEGLKTKMDEAIAKKDFSKAGELQEKIDALQQKIEAEAELGKSAGVEQTATVASVKNADGEEVAYESRSELEADISKAQADLSTSIAAKKFSQAEAIQAYIDRLEAVRTDLPTIHELKTLLTDKKRSMQNAIQEKRFRDAEDLDEEIGRLEGRLATEMKSAGPTAPPVLQASAPRAVTAPRVVATPPVVKVPTVDRAKPMSDRSVTSAPVVPRTVPGTKPKNARSAMTVTGTRPTLSTPMQAPRSIVDVSTTGKSVSKLRPSKPCVVHLNDSIRNVCQAMAAKRSAAAVVSNSNTGASATGIINDHDIVKRVVAQELDNDETAIKLVMTANPRSVHVSDDAMEALTIMVENDIRYLPVLDDSNAVTALLDIGRCLDEAITKLEKEKGDGDASASPSMEHVSRQLAGSNLDVSNAENLKILMQVLLAGGMDSDAVPSLRKLTSNSNPVIVTADTTILQAAKAMAMGHKAALVVTDGQLVGLVAFKDIITRVIAKNRPISSTPVSDIMTPHPEYASPDINVIEAMQMMHDHHFLTLPVCEDDGSIVGVVDVMDLIKGCGGANGWKSIFSSAIDIADDVSELSSVTGIQQSKPVVRSKPSNLEPLGETVKETMVSKLRPKKPMISSSLDTILAVTQMLANKRGDASLIVNEDGALAGIVTDTDITRRVVAKHVDAASTNISVVMTPNPTCVAMSDSAMDAMTTMVENHFRHLPVVDGTGAVVGLLDIAKCLNDAISKLEKSKGKGGNAAEDALKQAVNVQGASGSQAAALQALLGPLMAQAFGTQTSPTLRSLLAGKPSTVVPPSSSVMDAATLMADRRKASLVVDNGRLVGIFGFKDMMTRVVAKGLSVDRTAISSVMTPNPESVSPDITVLEALQTMHDNRFLTLPVCEDNGTVVGIVDVMDVIYGCGGAEGWRSVFSSSLELDDLSDTASQYSGNGSASASLASNKKKSSASVTSASAAAAKQERMVSKLRPKKPMISSSLDTILAVTQMLANKRGDASLIVNEDGALAGIVTDTDITRRVVAKHVDAASTNISVVMTPNPTCVAMSDSAMDAMTTMVENHFRHLPVVDGTGAVVGLLDIAKCLNDAISKLEKSKGKGGNAAEDALKQAVNVQGASGSQAAALQALLGPLMAQAFGTQTSPTLRSLLAGKPSTVVPPSSSVMDAATLMADRRKASLVVDNGRLVGIFGFKDMMTRVVAKGLSVDRTAISSVMTPNPESVSPDITVLEALQTMHDNRFLTLPVCEDNGTVVGIVDVMDVIYGCGGAEGWRSVFSSSLELDDLSDTASQYSGNGSASASLASNKKKSSASVTSASAAAAKQERMVSKLRPKKPMISSSLDTILAVTQMLANKRGDASLIVNEDGALAGIVTDTDITRRVVAKHVDAASTNISVVMTPNPTCVAMSDSAMDAMTTMVENHFRHLPVVDGTGAVVGLLDIAKCLNDAISKLEKSKGKGGNAAEDALKQAINVQGASGSQAAALQALLGPLMAQAFGTQTSPTLRSLLAGKPSTVVSPSSSVMDAATLMADRRKASLVVDNGRLVGIFGFKDMMTRVVAKGLSVDRTAISSVMTPNPESVSPDITVLEALQTMHDNRFLTLPVCEDNGTVVGIVDVMDVIYGCGGAEGWRSVFSSSLELDDLSDTASQYSGLRSSADRSKRSNHSKKRPADSKTVAKLRPRKALVASMQDTVLQVSQLLAQNRADASLIINHNGTIAGIITDTDFTRRVMAKGLDASTLPVSSVMTPNPTCVSMSDPALDALVTMVENHFRHLPVMNEAGMTSGVLDIAKCLNDAMSKLEKSKSKSSSVVQDALSNLVTSQQGSQNGQTAVLHALLQPLMQKAFGTDAMPSLKTILNEQSKTIVSPGASVADAARLMAKNRKATLVVSEGELIGILGFKDVMSQVIAKELDPETTTVESVMVPSPEHVSPDITVLEALQVMHDDAVLNLAVCEDDGTVLGIVDVMDVINGCGGSEGWRSLFDSAMDVDDDASDAQSAQKSKQSASRTQTSVVASLGKPVVKARATPVIRVAADAPFVSDVPGHIPRTLEFGDGEMSRVSMNDTSKLNDSHTGYHDGETVTYKIADPSGHTHRIKADQNLVGLKKAFCDKYSIDPKCLQFSFVDDEGDAIAITSNADLDEAVRMGRAAGNHIVKLTANRVEPKAEGLNPMVLAGVGAAVAVIGGIAMIALRPRR